MPRGLAPRPAEASGGGSVGLELDVDPAIVAPARLVGAGRLERATRGDRHLARADPEPAQVLADRIGAARAQAEVVLLGAPRIGAADQRDRLALGGAGGQAGGELIEHGA